MVHAPEDHAGHCTYLAANRTGHMMPSFTSFKITL